MTRLSSVVLPAPLHPARPITFISFSGPRSCRHGEEPTGLAHFVHTWRCFISAGAHCHATCGPVMRATTVTNEIPAIPGVLLAGGLARRMGGGDKPMRQIGGRTLLERGIARLKPQCNGLVLNANGDPARFAGFMLPVISDGVAGFPGPLAGVLAGLDWAAANRPDVAWGLSAAADCPFLPRDLVARLHRARAEQNAQLAVAASD